MSEQIAIQDRKLQLVGEIGQLEAKLAQTENNQREKEAKLQTARTNRWVGGLVLLIGLGLMFFVSLFFGGIVSLIGALTFFTAIIKHDNANADIKKLRTQIAELRGQLAEKRALLTVL